MGSSKTIPVYVNVYNRLTTTEKLVAQIKEMPGAEPVIIDNDSTWSPLLQWYEKNPCEVIRLRENLGHHAPWLSGVISGDNADYYVVTDCDLDLDGVPTDVLQVLREPFRWGQRPVKSGLALRIDDLPEWQTDVIKWESRWWKRRVSHDPRFFHAYIDTTFAMYQGCVPHRLAMQVVRAPAVRLAGDYQCRHMPWYTDCRTMTDEDRNYFATASDSNTWRPEGGRLVNYAR